LGGIPDTGDGVFVKLIRITILFALLIAGAATADNESRLREGGPPTGIRLAGTEDPTGIRLAGTEDALSESKVYIVQMRTPSAAEYHVTTSTSVAGKPTPGRSLSLPRFDKNSSAIETHTQRLAAEQAKVISSIGPNIEPIYSYRYAMNGFAARMTPAGCQGRAYAGSPARLGRRDSPSDYEL
jgi:hypothetical protein